MIPLVLLPGMMCDARLFAPQIAAFSARRAVHCAPLTGADRIDALAEAVLAHAPPRFALAGLSMGGIVAMAMARLAPGRIAGLALLDTNPLAEPEATSRTRDAQIARVQAGGLTAVMRDEMKPNYLTDSPHRAAILDLCMDMARALGPGTFIAQSHALQNRIDQSEHLSRIACPTLVLCGRDDALCPVARHEMMHGLIPGSRLVVIENAGHMPTLENPEETTAALADWLERLDG
ncbi:alpha/beta fold hydrolase [Oceaniglobus roseus]|uniref:alpha/beta fold hydrolase n=1 Tax=Oceaniglobus roseus TaxID=1737570 RepID=UPI000C7F3D8D|nr:alpha/beta fold hydrolase [Kandeliimicrobium roseum]